MPFMFGGIRENAKAKDLKKAEDMIDVVVCDHQSDVGDYYIFLLDKQPTDAIKQLILNRIRDEGYTNYMVLNAVECIHPLLQSNTCRQDYNHAQYEDIVLLQQSFSS